MLRLKAQLNNSTKKIFAATSHTYFQRAFQTNSTKQITLSRIPEKEIICMTLFYTIAFPTWYYYKNKLDGEIHQDPTLRKKVAIHESGHALVAHKLGFEVVEVNALLNKDRAGITKYYRPKICNTDINRDRICVSVAGPIADQLYNGYCGTHLNPDSSDFKSAKNIAKKIATTQPGTFEHNYEVNLILQEEELRAKEIIKDNEKSFQLLTKHLTEKHRLRSEEFLSIVSNETNDDNLPEESQEALIDNINLQFNF